MPVYEYRCQACQHEFEELVRSEASEKSVACPDCGGRKVERKLSVFAARQASEASVPPMGGCGRCGDPNGPCGL